MAAARLQLVYVAVFSPPYVLCDLYVISLWHDIAYYCLVPLNTNKINRNSMHIANFTFENYQIYITFISYSTHDQARGTEFGMKNAERYFNKSKYLGLKGAWPESYDLFLNFGTLPSLYTYKHRL